MKPSSSIMRLTAEDRSILRLAVPSIVSNITIPLLGLVDVAIVGHMDDSRNIAAIAVGTMIFNVMYWILGFIRMSVSGMTAQSYGRRELSGVAFFLVSTLLFSLSCAVILILFQQQLLHLMTWIMSPGTDVYPLVETYFRICIWGAPAVLGLYSLSGWFVGMQNTRFPMFIAIAQNVINIVCSLILVYGFGMQIAGVAAGTLVAQWSGMLVALMLLGVYYGRLSKYVGSLSQIISQMRHVAGRFMSINRDIFLRTLCIVGVNLFFTAFGSRQGDVILAANTVLMTFFTLFSYVMDGFAFAGEALAGRYYGAANRTAFLSVCKRLFVWGWAMVVAFTLAYLLGGKMLISMLTSQAEVIATALGYLVWALLIPLSGMAAFVFDGIFVGVTASRSMLISSVVATISFFFLYYLLRPLWGNHALWFALVVYLALRGLVQAYYFHRF